MKTNRISLISICILFLLSMVRAQWVKNENLPLWDYGLKVESPNSLVAAVSLTPNGIYRTLDGGLSWGKIGNYIPMDMTMVDAEHLWIATQYGEIIATTNGGEQWIRQYYDSTKTVFMNYIKMFSLSDGIAMGDALEGTLPAVILKTTDGGNQWISMNDSAFGGYTGDLWRRIQFLSPSLGFLKALGSGESSLWKTTDGGTTWQDLHITGQLEVLKFYNEDIGIACFGNFPQTTKIMKRTKNGGLTWDSVTTAISMKWGNDFWFCEENPAFVWFVDGQNLFFSGDTGRTWTMQYQIKGRDIVFSNKTVGWVLGDDMLLKTTGEGITQIFIDVRDQGLMRNFVLLPNYPNPFNPSTMISYQIPADGRVSVVVYDVLGNVMAELFNGAANAGYNAVVWNASNNAGAKVSSGMYLYRVTAELSDGRTFSDVKRMMLLK